MLRWFRRNREAVESFSDEPLSEIIASDITAEEFCERLGRLAPSVEQLMAEELSAEEAEGIRRMWSCQRVSQSDEGDPLLDLCSNFDLETVEIGYVVLSRPQGLGEGPYNADVDYWVIGHYEADPIVYPKSGGMVSIRDHEQPRKTMYRCARSPEGFLSALLVAAEPGKDADAKRRAVDRCVALAGKECEPFYKDLLNVEG